MLPGGEATEITEIVVRDAKDRRPDAPTLRFTTTEWDAFLRGALAGEFSVEALSVK